MVFFYEIDPRPSDNLNPLLTNTGSALDVHAFNLVVDYLFMIIHFCVDAYIQHLGIIV